MKKPVVVSFKPVLKLRDYWRYRIVVSSASSIGRKKRGSLSGLSLCRGFSLEEREREVSGCSETKGGSHSGIAERSRPPKGRERREI